MGKHFLRFGKVHAECAVLKRTKKERGKEKKRLFCVVGRERTKGIFRLFTLCTHTNRSVSLFLSRSRSFFVPFLSLAILTSLRSLTYLLPSS